MVEPPSDATPRTEPDERRSERHVLVVNQHGDNTGDEAALRGMLQGLDQALGGARFTVLHQFRERGSEVEVAQPVRWLSLVISPGEAVRLTLYALGLALGRRWRPVLGPAGEVIVGSYESADLVVSAPGGPYFGDLYWSHEPVHWFYVWLARLHRRPAALYAPSAGPFSKRVFNPFRRFTYRSFGVVTLREERSAEFYRQLMGHDAQVEVTADAALQQQVAPRSRSEWAQLGDRVLVALSAIDWRYAGDPDPEGRRENYDRSIAAALGALAAEVGDRGVHVVLVPQLHSRKHSDVEYLRRLAERFDARISWEVLEGERTSPAQRGVMAAADLVVAGRYHPAVFAVSAHVPVLCIPYEHKAAGMMDAAGLGDFVVMLDDVEPEVVSSSILDVWRRRAEIRDRLEQSEPLLRQQSAHTNDVVARLLEAP